MMTATSNRLPATNINQSTSVSCGESLIGGNRVDG
jgi:hypothetical protein